MRKASSKSAGSAPPIKPWGLYMLLFLFCFCTILGYISMNNVLQQKGREIQVLRNEVSETQNKYNKLRLQEAFLSSPKRIETIARDTFGMIPIDETNRVFYISTDSDNGDETAQTSKIKE